jgi:peroxiredoxin/cold shock CspA family protein
MPTNLHIGDTFPDFELPDHRGKPTKLSSFTQPSLVDKHLGFTDGYPLILIFGRGFFCPRDQQQMRGLVQFQSELNVNYGRLVTVSADEPTVQAAFRAGLGANWTFLSDEQRALIKQINILDETEGEYAYRAQPYTFVLRSDLSIHKIYNGWYFVGRPTLEELRLDLRAIMEARADYRYEAWTTPEVQAIRIPQQAWLDGAPELGSNGLMVAQGVVKWFDLASGNGVIARDGAPQSSGARDSADGDVFFNFTAIPGEGYRTVRAGTPVAFELVEGRFGPSARNVQVVKTSG